MVGRVGRGGGLGEGQAGGMAYNRAFWLPLIPPPGL